MHKFSLAVFATAFIAFLAVLAPQQSVRAEKPPADIGREYMTSDGKIIQAARSGLTSWKSDVGPDLATESAEAVVGPDSRSQVHNTDKYHWSAVAHLVMTKADGTTANCTGWFIDERTVITAGHCVYDFDGGTGWMKKIVVIPGRDNTDPSNKKPFGQTTMHRMFVNTGYSRYGYRDYDYGAIQTKDPLGNETGVFSYYWADKNKMEGKTVRVTSYPCDKPYGTMWTATDKINKGKNRRYIHQVDTFNCSSGAPVYHKSGNCYPCVMGINVAHYTNGYWNGYNIAVRVNGDVIDNFVEWSNYAYP